MTLFARLRRFIRNRYGSEFTQGGYIDPLYVYPGERRATDMVRALIPAIALMPGVVRVDKDLLTRAVVVQVLGGFYRFTYEAIEADPAGCLDRVRGAYENPTTSAAQVWDQLNFGRGSSNFSASAETPRAPEEPPAPSNRTPAVPPVSEYRRLWRSRDASGRTSGLPP